MVWNMNEACFELKNFFLGGGKGGGRGGGGITNSGQIFQLPIRKKWNSD